MASVEKIYLKDGDKWIQYSDIYLNNSKFAESKRGISFISLKGNNRLTDDENKGFCHNRFKANFVIEDLDLGSLAENRLLQIGHAIIKVTKVNKECISKCPIIINSSVSCDVNKEAFFGEIFKEGLIKEKDEIVLL